MVNLVLFACANAVSWCRGIIVEHLFPPLLEISFLKAVVLGRSQERFARLRLRYIT